MVKAKEWYRWACGAKREDALETFSKTCPVHILSR